ncbi:MAG TPA: SLC13 family permease [Candidatus Krumholzibacteria bacterium]|nr:SLC13 family permease [Candidatus Krumholzibacteria bacterium]
MTPQIALLLSILVLGIVMFWWERVSPDVTALGILLALVLTGLLPAELAFSGFGSHTVMLILGLLIMTAALQRTGVVDLVGRAMMRRAGQHPAGILLLLMFAAATMSAFMSNTAATAFFLPIVFSVAQRTHIAPSRLFMPLAFASILSSSITLVSTSTNVVVSGVMRAHGMEPMGLFELTPAGIPIALAGMAYMLLIGRRLVPSREPPGDPAERFGLRPYLSELILTPKSALTGKTLEQAKIGESMGLTVLHIVRDKNRFIQPDADTLLLDDDVLVVEGTQEDILRVKDIGGVEIKADVRLSDPELQKQDVALVEAIVLPGSPLIGRTLKGYRFRERFGLQVLGLNSRGVSVVRKMSQIPLRVGDVLLMQGRRDVLSRMRDERAFQILGRMELMEAIRPKRSRAPVAIGAFVAALALAAFDVMPLAVAVMLGVLIVFATRCISPAEAYATVDWRVIIMIAALLGLGTAMQETGAAGFLARLIVAGLGDAGPRWLLTGFFALTVLLTQPMSNQAAAIVVLPVALQAAALTDLNPRQFAMMIAIAASCSYLTPLEPSCAMVYGPGGYRFRDFVRVGAPLTILIFAIALYLVPRLWP